MISTRRSPSSSPNPHLRDDPPHPSEGNAAWLGRHGDADGVVLFGGTSVPDFRIRVAQSLLRHDMTPSSWSHCGILLADGAFASVLLDLREIASVPRQNGVQIRPLADYDDPERYPNVAVVRFAEKHDDAIADIERVGGDRGIVDLPSLMLPWLAFVWGTQDAGNPLATGRGLPSASFVETVFAMAGFDLTPGLSSLSSCPEAIWQSARWWNQYYEGAVSDARASAPDEGAEDRAALPMIPTGAYAVRQKHAAIFDHDALPRASSQPK